MIASMDDDVGFMVSAIIVLKVHIQIKKTFWESTRQWNILEMGIIM
jgi:hypothetical protein